MKKLFKNIILFFVLLIATGEIVVRFTHAVSDIPKRIIDENGIQKYRPNQKGYWKGGEHSWIINEYGWPGKTPSNYDNLITIIGDSFIENFMNPNECHQSVFLSQMLPEYNFMEFGRSGVSFIEALEICKQIDTLNAKQNLIYVNNQDFYESIIEVKRMPDITQFSLEKETVVFGKMKASKLKTILYNWKLLYYFYNRFPLSHIKKNIKPKSVVQGQDLTVKMNKIQKNYIEQTNSLIEFVKRNYNLNNKILVFHPNSNSSIIELTSKAGFKTIVLDSSDDSPWTFDYDKHWTCYGNKKVAEQVKVEMLNILK